MKLLFSLFIFGMIGVFGFSEEKMFQLDDLLPVSVAKELKETGRIQRSAYKDEKAKITLTPSLDLAKKAISGVDPRSCYFVEILYLYEKHKATKVETDKIAHIFRSLSSLEGLKYFSTSKQSIQVLYEKSYTIISKKNKAKIADNFIDKTNGLRLFALQKDNFFGENVFQYDYALSENTVSLQSTNSESLKKGFIPIISEGNLQGNLIVHDLTTHLLIYIFTQAKFINIPGLEGKLNSSFSTRAEALYDWFIGEYEN